MYKKVYIKLWTKANFSTIQQWENIAKYKCKSSEAILERGKKIEKLKIRPMEFLTPNVLLRA
jgi:hypothetical protein